MICPGDKDPRADDKIKTDQGQNKRHRKLLLLDCWAKGHHSLM